VVIEECKTHVVDYWRGFIFGDL
jgi:hypothetical protein